MFCYTLLYVHSSFAIILVGKRGRAGCFAWFVFLVSSDGCVALPCSVMGLSAVCDSILYLSYSLTVFNCRNCIDISHPCTCR